MRLKFIKFVVLVVLFASIASAEIVTVITKQNAIREYPRFFSPIKATVKYNDSLDVITREGDWLKVRFKDKIGYIHKTAVEKRTFSASATTIPKKTGTTEEEITLAGKGFNAQVEKGYKEKNPNMRYELVDKVEKYDISERELISFIKAGGLLEPK